MRMDVEGQGSWFGVHGSRMGREKKKLLKGGNEGHVLGKTGKEKN